jgi:hypothetical protein
MRREKHGKSTQILICVCDAMRGEFQEASHTEMLIIVRPTMMAQNANRTSHAGRASNVVEYCLSQARIHGLWSNGANQIETILCIPLFTDTGQRSRTALRVFTTDWKLCRKELESRFWKQFSISGGNFSSAAAAELLNWLENSQARNFLELHFVRGCERLACLSVRGHAINNTTT